MGRLYVFKQALILFCIINLATIVIGQAETWRSYTNGNHVNNIVIHGDTIWCATDGGVVRWDMSDMSSSLFNVTDGLPDNNVLSIAVDSTGTIWAGTEWGGVCSYDGMHWRTYDAQEGIGDRYISDIAISPDNHVYVTTRYGAYKYDGTDWNTIPANALLERHDCISIAAENNFWVGKLDGVKHYNSSAWTAYPMTEYMEDPWVRSVLVDGDDVWAASFTGLARYHDGLWESYAESNVASLRIVDIAKGPDGAIWFASLPDIGSGGLSCFVENDWHNYYVPWNHISAIIVDDNNFVWGGNVLETGAVLFKYSTQNQQFQYYRESTDRAALDNVVKSIIQTNEGDILAGTQYGLSRLNDGEWSVVYDDESGGIMTRSPEGDIYIGGEINGLYRLSGGERILVEGFAGMYITCMVFADETDYWVGTSHSQMTNGGLYHNDNGTWAEYHVEDGLPDGTILAVAVGQDGSVWVGTSGGLARYAEGDWQTYTAEDIGMTDRDSYIPTSLAVDASGTLYVGTQYGLYTASGGQFSKCFDEPVISIYKDDLDRIWIVREKGTEFGFAHFFGIYSGSDEYTEYMVPFTPQRTKIDCIYYDDQDNTVWIGTDYNGLFSLSLDNGDGVEEPEIPVTEFSLGDNFPNPFNASTTIPYTLSADKMVQFVIYNVTGQVVTSFRGNIPAGHHTYIWDGKDARGNEVPSGVYMYSLHIEGAVQSSKKMLMIK